jgi:hypothetical protein
MKDQSGDIVWLTALNTIVPFLLGMAVMLALGYGWLLALVIGLTRMPATEAVIVPILDEFKLIRTRVGEFIIGAGVLDDVIEVILVAFVSVWIGEIGLDGKLLDYDYAVTEIDEGCVCCTLVGNLKKAIHQILSSFHPDYTVLETTGLANPYNLLDEISEVDDMVRFDSITTMVDGVNVEKSLEEYDVARNQIKAADILLLNKKDKLTKMQLDRIKQKIKAVNSSAPIIETTHGDVNPALIYGVDLQDNPEVGNRKAHQRS